MLWGGRGERKRERAGHDGKEPFPSSHRPPRAFYFFDYFTLMRIPSGSLCGGERCIAKLCSEIQRNALKYNVLY